jgi:hypothetical protein
MSSIRELSASLALENPGAPSKSRDKRGLPAVTSN